MRIEILLVSYLVATIMVVESLYVIAIDVMKYM